MELKIYKCQYCNKEFSSKQKLGGHATYCDYNPNKYKNLHSLSNVRTHINYNGCLLNCQYCGKEIHNQGCLVLHEKRCKKNPNYVPTELQLEKEKKKQLPKNKIHLSEEHKNKIRKSLAKWRIEHKEDFLLYSRGKSKCCENFKNMLRNNGIDFVEEYAPYIPDKLYSLDIAWPDEKIAIEINGSQHYDENGDLNDYTLNKQKYFEERGWKIIQIHYQKCYNISINDFSDILKLPIHDKEYVKENFDIPRKIKQNKEIEKENRIKEKEIQYKREEHKKYLIIQDLIENSGIDFSKSGWSSQGKIYLKSKNNLWDKNIFRNIRKYFPDFLKLENVWKRKGAIY